MPERGAVPMVSPLRRRALRLAGAFTAPLRPDDYLELFNPLWSTRELRGRVERVEPAGPVAVTVTIKPGWEWPGHRPGQYVRLGIDVDGIHHWRAYSLTSAPDAADGCIQIMPKLVAGGAVSPYLHDRLRPGTIVRLGGVEGTFTLPQPLPRRLLFVTAGSGITPVMSMLRSIGAGTDVSHVHCERTPAHAIFGDELRRLAAQRSGYELHERVTAREGRLTLPQLERLCPDWRERETFACGPAALLHALGDHWRAHGEPARLHVERFQPEAGVGDGERGCGGTIELCRSGVRASSDGELPILLAGERAGATLPFGCRMGICHSCVGRLRAGSVRDLRTGRVHGQLGELVRTCVNAPEGPIEIDL